MLLRYRHFLVLCWCIENEFLLRLFRDLRERYWGLFLDLVVCNLAYALLYLTFTFNFLHSLIRFVID